MLKYLKPILAVVCGTVIFFAITYLLLMVDKQVAFLGGFILPLLTGLLFKVKGKNGLLIYSLCISVPPAIGFGVFSYFTGSNIVLLFIPFVIVSAALGSYLRNNIEDIYSKNIGLAVGSYALVGVLVALAFIPNMKLLTQNVNEPIPSVELMTLEKETIPISETGKKIVVLDFWATWCGPCLQLMPELESLNKKYADNPKVAVKAVNTSMKNSFQDVRKFLQENPKEVDVLYDKDGTLTEKLGIRGIPYTVIIDTEKGKVLMRKQGFTPSQNYVKTMSKYIDRLLKSQGT